MSIVPETRASLVGRLHQGEDAVWQEFARIYQPLIYSHLRSRGLQHQDSLDVMQEVLLVFTSFDYDPAKRFRWYLYAVIRSKLSDFIRTRKKQPPLSGEEWVHDILDEKQQVELEERWNREYQLYMFRLAADKIEPEAEEAAWKAFEQTQIFGRPSGDVAEELGMSSGAVRTAASRMVKRIREKICTMEKKFESHHLT